MVQFIGREYWYWHADDNRHSWHGDMQADIWFGQISREYWYERVHRRWERESVCEYTVRVLAWVTRREDRYWHKDGGGGGERGGHIEGVLLWANRQTIRTSTEREVLSRVRQRCSMRTQRMSFDVGKSIGRE